MIERHPSVVSRPVGGSWVLIPLARAEGRLEENMLRLDGVAARVWELLGEPCTLQELLERLETEYEVDGEQLKADITGFLAHLEELRAVRQKPTDG